VIERSDALDLHALCINHQRHDAAEMRHTMSQLKPFEVVQNDSIENTQTVVSRHASERAAWRAVRAEIARQNNRNRKYARFLKYSIRSA